MAKWVRKLPSINQVDFVDLSGHKKMIIDPSIVEFIGGKAYGLSCLPAQWTLPYIVISKNLVSDCRSKSLSEIDQWLDKILIGTNAVGILPSAEITVRSSGCSEGIDERGKFYSSVGLLKDLKSALSECIQKILSDSDLDAHEIPLIVQQYANKVLQKGHLSNERRLCKEGRDWIGEIERSGAQAIPFQINLRNWRQKLTTEQAVKESLKCDLTAHVKDTMKIVCTWTHEAGIRVHFEWVWDGVNIFVVQADEENSGSGENPTELAYLKIVKKPEFTPKALKIINEVHSKFNKVKNVFIYRKLGLPTTNLYILEDETIIDKLSKDVVDPDLKSDIEYLVKYSLVIRMDLETEEKAVRQLLPRTNELRDSAAAVDWLIEQSKRKLSDKIIKRVFIFHNFIPAVSSAFAYSAPGERKVQIEALWGLPEGLYYNKHDKYVVDTIRPNLENVGDEATFKIRKKIRAKNNFVAPDSDGIWENKRVSIPYDWAESIQDEKWLRTIALQTRKIANEVGYSVSVMWFIDVRGNLTSSPVLPWYHEAYDPSLARESTTRTKTIFDKSLLIQTGEDLKKLRIEAALESSNVRRIRIQPTEETLLRDKNTLQEIGELAKKINAIILLEGGVLSHAYYQLLETKAVVEVLDPFDEFDEEIEFNKLVRDKVPKNIESGGETVRTANLEGELLLKALKEKLVEEALETLDAGDTGSIIAEMADVYEVMDAILKLLDVEKKTLLERQIEKHDKAGGFEKGIVLLKTDNPVPTEKSHVEGKTLPRLDEEQQYKAISGEEIFERAHQIVKWTDRRNHEGSNESILKITIPIVRGDWTAQSGEIKIENSSEKLRVLVKGERHSSKTQIEISIFTSQTQLELFKK